MQFADALTIDAPRRTREGFLVVRARAARAGVYDYLGSEVDPEGKRFKANDTVKVYRPADEVFAADSVASFIARPVTNDHPSQPVTADNWKKHSRGAVMGALRDGEYLAFDLTVMDKAAIADIEAGKRELSNGYSCTLDFQPGTAPDGTRYDAVQRDIRGNHVAIVSRGRAGSECRIGDAQDRFAACDANHAALSGFQPEKKMKSITLDGLPVNLGDEAAVEAAIVKLQDAATKAKADLADATTQISTLTGEKTALETKLADAEAKAKPEALDRLVADRAALVAKAKAVKADIVIDGKADADIRRDVVAAKIGDAAKDMDDAAVAGAFAVLTADAKAEPAKSVTPLVPATFADTAHARDAIRAARYS